MFLSGYEVVAGSMTVGEFVMIQAYIMQLAQPLAWLVRLCLSLFVCLCLMPNVACVYRMCHVYAECVIRMSDVCRLPNATSLTYG